MDHPGPVHRLLRSGTLLLVALLALYALLMAGRTVPSLPPLPTERFLYPPATPIARLDPIDGSRSVVRYRLALEGAGPAGGDAEGLYSHPRRRGRAPFVLLLPALGGRGREIEFFAEYLTRKGFACLRLRRPEKLLDAGAGLAHTREVLRREVVRIRRVIDWASGRREIDPARIGLLGVSTGALSATIAAAVEERIGAIVLVLAGGDLPRILIDSQEAGVEKFRRRLMERRGWSREELLGHARSLLQGVDPLRFAQLLDPGRTLMVEAYFDRVIPAGSRHQLWIAAGQPPRIVLPAGHYSSIAMAHWVRWRTYRFLRDRLGPDAAPAPVARTGRPGPAPIVLSPSP